LIKKWKSLYASPDDVDLFVGLFSEFPIERALVGPTTAGCELLIVEINLEPSLTLIFSFNKGIIAKQFRDWKFGDRFYYETGDKNLRFTRDQLESIRKVTMAGLLCNHIDVDFVQQFAFFIAKKDANPFVDCKSIPKLSLSLWADENLTSSNCAATNTTTKTTTSTTTTTTPTSTTTTVDTTVADCQLVILINLKEFEDIGNSILSSSDLIGSNAGAIASRDFYTLLDQANGYMQAQFKLQLYPTPAILWFLLLAMHFKTYLLIITKQLVLLSKASIAL
jgi:hypothetical protein